ncbi:MAG: STAS/SEC14 domain-containing protein [Bacteroidia bacterium]
MKEHYIDHEFFEIWLENGIVYEIFKKNSILDLPLARQVVQERLKVSNCNYTPIFIDLRNIFYTDTKARKYLATQEAVNYITAGAMLLDNEIMKLAGNIFIKIDKPLIPTKLFTDRDKALLWLQSYKHSQ